MACWHYCASLEAIQEHPAIKSKKNNQYHFMEIQGFFKPAACRMKTPPNPPCYRPHSTHFLSIKAENKTIFQESEEGVKEGVGGWAVCLMRKPAPAFTQPT